MSARDSGIDTLAGFFVVYIAIGHALNLYHIPSYNLCPSPFLYFFMPWFFYKGGMFFRYKDEKEAFRQNTKRLLKPFIIWTVVGILAYNFIALFSHSSIHGPKRWLYEMLVDGSIYENKPLWFLLSLMIVKTIANSIVKIPPPPKNGA